MTVGSSARRLMAMIFPTVPAAWQADFETFQRQLARRIAVVAALAILILLPAFQFIDYVIYESQDDLHLHNALWRLPVSLAALGILFLRWKQPDGAWPRPLLLLMAFALMTMMVGIFANDKVFQGGAADYTSQGLIITIAAVSMAATRGLRDIPVIYGLPFLSLPFLLIHNGVALSSVTTHLVYPAAMLVVACIVVELIYHSNIRSFMANQQLKESAMTDPLTGLLNRRAMSKELTTAHARSLRHEVRYAIIMADLDRFKRVNDAHGHDVGDQVLVELGNRLTTSLRREDRVSRWGGEEFLMLVQDTDESASLEVAEKIRKAVEEAPFPTSAGPLPITLSLGLALNSERDTTETVIIRADKALYQAKQNGRNRVELAE